MDCSRSAYCLWVSARSLSTSHLPHTSAVFLLELSIDDKPYSSGEWERTAPGERLPRIRNHTGGFPELSHAMRAVRMKIFPHARTHSFIHSTLGKGHLCSKHRVEIDINKTHFLLSRGMLREGE